VPARGARILSAFPGPCVRGLDNPDAMIHDIPGNPSGATPRGPRLLFVTHRPGPGFGPDRHRDTVFPPILPDEAALLYREAVNHAHNRFCPALGDAPRAVHAQLWHCAETALLREAEWSAVQREEWAFAAECASPPDPDWPEAWRDRLALPLLHALQDMRALDPYEYGLVYLLLGVLERQRGTERDLEGIRDLLHSWQRTMDPGTGRFSLLALRLALRARGWWGRLPGVRDGGREPVARAVVGALEGAVVGLSGQGLGGARRVDWNRAFLPALQGALGWSLAELPAVRRWRERERGRRLRAVAEPVQGLLLPGDAELSPGRGDAVPVRGG
jgi:hypothetical protein